LEGVTHVLVEFGEEDFGLLVGEETHVQQWGIIYLGDCLLLCDLFWIVYVRKFSEVWDNMIDDGKINTLYINDS
jgi:hypothetical protein